MKKQYHEPGELAEALFCGPMSLRHLPDAHVVNSEFGGKNGVVNSKGNENYCLRGKGFSNIGRVMGHIQTYLFPIGVAGWFLLTLLIEFRGKGSAIIKVGKLAVIWFVLNDICAIVFSIHQQTNHDIQKMHGTPPNFIFVKFMFCLVPWTICLLWAVVFYFRRRLKVSRTAQESATKMNQAS